MMLYLLLKFTVILAGKQTLTPNIWVNWTAGTDNVTFILAIDSSVYSENKWAGIGLKAADVSQDMIGSEIVSFYLGSIQSCKNRYALQNAFPPLDQVSDITCANRIKENSYYLYSWTRPYDTRSTNGFDLTGQDRIMIIWAIGDMTSGDIAKHGNTDNDRGHQIIYLTGSTSFTSKVVLCLELIILNIF